jgi:hypothetical protein
MADRTQGSPGNEREKQGGGLQGGRSTRGDEDMEQGRNPKTGQGAQYARDLYEQEKFREMPTKELLACLRDDPDAGRAKRAEEVLKARNESKDATSPTSGLSGTGTVDTGTDAGFDDEATPGNH